MSMLERKEIIEDGDWVVLYEGFGSVKSVQVKAGQSYQNRVAHFSHNDIIGKRYGSQVPSSAGRHKGELTVLHPTPQLWTDVLNHRTQILFQMDISLVLHHLDLKPGSVIVESGTGSGSLTTSLARAVAPHGHVHSFEFNLDRVNKAKEDFNNNGLTDVITVRHRNVCSNGFPFFPEGVDAVFLDLPSPWVVLDDCHRNLRPQGKICSFSPCIEQVQRVCVRLEELGYEDIFTIEVLTKRTQIHQSRIKSVDLNQMRADLPKCFRGPPPAKEETKIEVVETNDSAEATEPDAKRQKTAVDATVESEITSDISLPARFNLHKIQVPSPFLITKPNPTMRGHTGYLTFARKPVKCVIGQHDTLSRVEDAAETKVNPVETEAAVEPTPTSSEN